MTRPFALAASVVVLASTSLACGAGDKVKQGLTEMTGEKITEQVLEGATGGNLQIDGGAQVDLSDLPPILTPPGVTGKGRMNMTNEGGTGTLYMMESTDSVATILAWYKQSLATWKLATELATGDGTMLMYNSPDDSVYAQITVAPGDEGKVAVTVLHVAKFKTPPTP